MIAIIVLLWFVLGIAGGHLAFAIDKHNGAKGNSADIWLLLLGPVVLIIAIMIAIQTLEKK